MDSRSGQDRRLSAIAEATAQVLRSTPYQAARAEEIAKAVRLDPPRNAAAPASPSSGRRSAVWLHNEVRSRRVLVALAAFHAWQEHLSGTGQTGVAEPPRTLTQACALVSEALAEVARFHRAERFLMAQVRLGIGDIATTEKRAAGDPAQPPPTWPDTPQGQAAAHGFHGRITVFADFLTPVLDAATRTLTLISPDRLRAGAEQLSDLAFHAFVVDGDRPISRMANGLTAYWFEHDLLEWTGGWSRDLYSLERSMATVRNRQTSPRAAAWAREALIWCLLGAGTLHQRSAEEGARLVGELRAVTGWTGDRPRGEHTDLRMLCDATSRHGLALMRYGDLTAAKAAHEFARTVATRGISSYDEAEGESFALRADHNLAEVDLEAGQPADALKTLTAVHERRRAMARLADGPESAALWRRFSQSAGSLALASAAAGQVVTAVCQAEETLADRRRVLEDRGAASVAAARVLLAECLLAAGHPVEARQHVDEAHSLRASYLVPTGYWWQHDLVLKGRVALALGDHGSAARLLEDALVVTPWFAERISYRLGTSAQALLILAGGLSPDATGEAIERMRALLGGLDRYPWAGARDPLPLRVRRYLATLLLAAGESALAQTILVEIEGVRGDTIDDPVGAVRTARLLARCADRDLEAAGGHLSRALRIAEETGMDALHPALHEIRFEQAARLVQAGTPEPAAALLETILEHRLLAHGRPPLSDAHPVLVRSRALAAQAGLARPPSTLAHNSLWDAE